MQCKELGESLSAYLDGELDAETSENLARHLSQCASCAADFGSLKAIDEEVLALQTLDPGSGFTRRVVARVDAWDFFSGEPIGKQTVVSALMELLGELLDLLGMKRETTTGSLDEFGDCPPLSMGSVFFRIIGESGRG